VPVVEQRDQALAVACWRSQMLQQVTEVMCQLRQPWKLQLKLLPAAAGAAAVAAAAGPGKPSSGHASVAQQPDELAAV